MSAWGEGCVADPLADGEALGDARPGPRGHAAAAAAAALLANLRAIYERCSTLATASPLVQHFARLLRERRGQNQLVAWIEAVEDADIPELRTFASGLRNDWAAVTASLAAHGSGNVRRLGCHLAVAVAGSTPPARGRLGPDPGPHRVVDSGSPCISEVRLAASSCLP